MTDLPDRGMKAGEKHKWLRLHYDEIMAYYQDHGEAATRAKYNIRKQASWDGLISGAAPRVPKFSKADRAIDMAKMAMESNREVKVEVRELRKDFRQFVNLVGNQVAAALIIPLIQAQIKLPAELEEKMADPLSFANFNPELAKQGREKESSCYVKRDNKYSADS